VAHSPSSQVDEPAPGKSLYERDPYAWSIEQARVLREARLDEIDVENVADEIRSVGLQQLDQLEEALIALLTSLLIWDHRLEGRSADCGLVIDAQRRRVKERLSTSPSLRARLDEAVQWSFGIARLKASSEIDVDVKELPNSCPYDWEAIVSRPLEQANGVARTE
jgi:hypothetical protein